MEQVLRNFTLDFFGRGKHKVSKEKTFWNHKPYIRW